MEKFKYGKISNKKAEALIFKILDLESKKSVQETLFHIEQGKIQSQIKETEQLLTPIQLKCGKTKEGHIFLYEELASIQADLTIRRCQKCGAWGNR